MEFFLVIIDSISSLVLGLLRFSISSSISFGILCFQIFKISPMLSIIFLACSWTMYSRQGIGVYCDEGHDVGNWGLRCFGALSVPLNQTLWEGWGRHEGDAPEKCWPPKTGE